MAEQIGGIVFSPHYRFVYIHVPKTAGGSLKRALLAQCPDARSPALKANAIRESLTSRLNAGAKDRLTSWLSATPLRYFVAPRAHSSMALMLLSHPSFWHYRRFAFVRNPYDRLVSAYEYGCQYHDYAADFGTYADRCLRHLRPQVDMLYFSRHRLVDWIGRFETLEEDAEIMARRLSLPKLSLIHRNRTERRRYEDYFTPSLKRRVEECYQADFAMFGYPTSLKSSR